MPDASRVKAMLTEALGPVIRQALSDPQTSEVMVNPDQSIWHERQGAPAVCIGHQAPETTAAVIRLLATLNQTVVTFEQPSLDATLPTGERFKGFLPPRVRAPAFCIRVPQAQVLTREHYVPACCPAEIWEVMARAVAARENVVLVGGMSSGKTTLMNTLIRLIPPEIRVASVEDTAELSISVPNSLQLYTSVDADLQAVVKEGFRTAAQRILVGEIRDGVTAINTLKLWLGVGGGICTLHAGSAKEALLRLERLCDEVGQGQYQPLIGEVIDLVVFLEHVGGQRLMGEVLRVYGWNGGDYETAYVWKRPGAGAADRALPVG
jgi:type IV secretion system protein TrbB